MPTKPIPSSPKVVVVTSPEEVLVDGESFGAVADTISNNPHLAASIQRALQAWHDDKKSKDKEARAAEFLAEKETHRCEKESRDAEQGARIEALQSTAIEAARLQAIFKQLSTVADDKELSPEDQLARLTQVITEALKPERQRRRETLEAEVASKQTELDELTT